MTVAIRYTSTDTATRFHLNNSFVRFLFGPVGCGKSVAGCIEILHRAVQQAPDADGIRRSRWAVIRNTFPDLKSTTIATWKTWYPEEEYGKIKWESPIIHHLKKDLDDGTKMDCEVLFIALDSDLDIKKLRSLELTGAYINEAQYIDYQIFLTCTERVNRYPPKVLGAPITWTGVIADTNPPDTRHWIYRVIDTERPEGHEMFFYEPAVLRVESMEDLDDGLNHAISRDGTIYINNPNADYVWVQNDPGYWLKLIPGRTDEEIKVVIEGRYGLILDGKPVHPTYNDHLHFANKPIAYNPAVQLGLGWDFGLTPACAINQLTPRGNLVVLDELWSEDMGVRDFAKNIVVPHLDMHYPGWRDNYVSVGDPSGDTKTQTEANTCFEVLAEEGIYTVGAADTNDATARRDGLKYFLGKMVDGLPAFSLSSKVIMLRTGLLGAFKYARLHVGGDARYHEKPLKNIYSHICEAEEYIAMHYAPQSKKPAQSSKRPCVIKRGNFMAL